LAKIITYKFVKQRHMKVAGQACSPAKTVASKPRFHCYVMKTSIKQHPTWLPIIIITYILLQCHLKNTIIV